MRRGARWLLGGEAAVELLVAHGFWLLHPGLVAAAVVEVGEAGDAAVLGWAAARAELADGRLAFSPGQGHVLQIAAGLATDAPVALGQAMCGLDEPAARAVAAAVLHAAGYGHLPATGFARARVRDDGEDGAAW